MHKFLSEQEFIDLPMGQDLVFDIEVFKNYMLLAFKVINTNQYIIFQATENQALHRDAVRWFISRHRLIGFNSERFDMPILTYALTGANTQQVKMMCDKIIIDNLNKYDIYSDFQLEKLPIRHIDVINVCPGQGSLEMYGARLHAHSIVGMPVSPEKYLTQEEIEKVGWYCLKDLDITELIYKNLSEEMELRDHMSAEFQIDLMSRSDAQIAEQIMKSELKRHFNGRLPKSKSKPGDYFEYDAPSWIMFLTPPLQKLLEEVLDSDFTIDEKGSPTLPTSLKDRTVTIGTGTYAVGIGGLHSTETCQTIEAPDGGYLLDVDVASYYPAIILNNKFYPEHIGEVFGEIYQGQVTSRLIAKKEGRKSEANSRKIVVNGLYGKLGDKWSCVYSPKNMLQVTLTGQLALLMLIEYAEQCEVKVVSANTDGVVFYIRNDEELDKVREIVSAWCTHTGFQTEETFYKSLHSRDVNNYIAIKTDNSIKTKGQAYSLPEGTFRFQKNPDCNIVTKAIISYLTKGVPLEDTITSCEDIRDFLVARNVTGGGEFVGEKLGKTVRWYYSRYSKKAYITSLKRGDKVARSEGAKPIQVLPDEFPVDVDFEKYIQLAEEALYLIGAKTRFNRHSKIFSDEELAMLDVPVVK